MGIAWWGATSSVRGIAKPGTGTKDRTGSNASTNPGVGVENEVRDVLKGYRRVVVIGMRGWLPGAMIRTEVRIFFISPSFILYHYPFHHSRSL